jgi:hypothetical protein
MEKQKKSLNKHLYDALLEISETDSNESKRLLQQSGINPDQVLSTSLGKINDYKVALRAKLNPTEKSLITSVKTKINDLLKTSPERTNAFLNSYFKQHSLNIQFQSRSKIDDGLLNKVKSKVDLNDLSKKLDDNDESR